MKLLAAGSLVATGIGLLVLFGAVALIHHHGLIGAPSRPLAHVQNSFELIVHAPYPDAARLFGPEGERSWGHGRWNPRFLYPQPGQDIQGAVFTVDHSGHPSLWINTVMSVPERHFQYVYFIPDVLVTMIDVRFLPIDSGNTRVSVTYIRTALNPKANEHVQHLGTKDALSGPDWERDVNSYLTKLKPPDLK